MKIDHDEDMKPNRLRWEEVGHGQHPIGRSADCCRARAGREMAGSTFSKKTHILPTMLDSTIVFRQLDGCYK